MKKFIFMMMALTVLAASCQKTPEITTADIKVALELEGNPFATAGINVSIKDMASGTIYEAETDEAGEAAFTLTAGLYEASAQYKTSAEGIMSIFNGINSSIVVVAGQEETFPLEMLESKTSQIVIKEYYFGGCTKADGKNFANDAYVILYNNSDCEADASDICFGFVNPFNSNTTNKYLVDGKLFYEAEGWVPTGYSVWWFQTDVTIAPWSQILVAIKGGTDNTATVPESVDLSKADYYMYDPESGFNNAATYPAPPASMSVDHYLKTYVYGMGNAWPMSQLSPAFYIFRKEGVEAFAKDANNFDTTENAKLPCLKVPVEWIVDGIEVFNSTTQANNNKRMVASVDAGYLNFLSKKGYTAYRNVDKEATEALAENEGKLVYNYAGGTEAELDGSTDPSGIDAEASIANGAHIVYKDTNNSTVDFHQRKVASIK